MKRSAQRAVREAIVDRLAAWSQVADGRIVTRTRVAMAGSVQQQVFVRLDEARPERGEIAGAPVDWQTRIRIECVARSSAAASAEDLADDTACDIYELLMADPSLDGDAMDMLPPGLAWDHDEADQQIAVCHLLLTVLHRTQEHQLIQP